MAWASSDGRCDLALGEMRGQRGAWQKDLPTVVDKQNKKAKPRGPAFALQVEKSL
jgi:hypothetical protein